MTRVSQLWDLIETWGFREDIKDIDADNVNDADNDTNDVNNINDTNDKDGNDDKGISALGLDRDMGFSPKTPLKINFLAILSIERQVYMQKYNFFVKQIFF